MSEEIKHNFQQAESIKPITESEKEYTEEEIDEIEIERAKTYSEANEETGEEKLFASQEQIRKIHEDTEKITEQESLNEQIETKEAEQKSIQASGIRDVQTTIKQKYEETQRKILDEKKVIERARETEQTKKKGIKVIAEDVKPDEIVAHSWGGFRVISKSASERGEVFRKGKTQRDRNHDTRSEKDIIEDFLWKKAESLQQVRTDLEKKINILETEIASMRSRRLNLHEQNVLGKKEDEYQILTPQLNQKKQEEEEIQEKLIDLEYGMMSAKIKNEIIHAVEGDEIVSKRRQKIEEEQSRIQKELNITDERYAAQIARKGGQQGTHLTTGRHATQIKGNIDSASAAEEFYHRTADTHGGKVSYGKRSKKSTSGKTIRKS